MHDEDYFNTRECWDADPMVSGSGSEAPGCFIALPFIIISIALIVIYLIDN
ncbi:hypothetical protein [Carboxylicivirga linearis]|uniref:Uncharacterized protein n=1 Tax=Carboxylicivirga linearis TaxID=1628157 RepID=A0ABS5K0M1_9BACT|nr:hypothetical protein [Carboxylicivirga linearis]MBS2100687.1 hypothetical protein [Carboxylicivirga linearis]